jgi:hypothetical protein
MGDDIAPVIDFESRQRLNTSIILWNAEHRPDSPDAKAVRAAAAVAARRAWRGALIAGHAANQDGRKKQKIGIWQQVAPLHLG